VRHDGTGRDKSRPHFGTDEALEFATQAGAELLITVNAGTGTAAEAADWVRYVNGRGQRVRYWEIGNELYINDGSPISKEITVDPATYAKRVREFAQAMRAADPKIQIGAIGGENQPPYGFVHYRDWNKTVLQGAGDQIDYFAIHNAYAPVSVPDQSDFRQVYEAMLASPVLIARNLATVARQIQEFAPTRPGGIPIAVTEWGPLFQVDPKGRYAQHNKTLGSALFVASALKVLIESPVTNIANFHLLNDLGFMGWIGPARGASFAEPQWTPTPRYYSFELFSRHFGPQLLRSEAQSPTYDTPGVGAVGAVQKVPYLDVISSLSADSHQLFLIAINKDLDRPIEATIELDGFAPAATATAWSLNGSGVDANTGTAPLPIPGLTWGRPVEDPDNPRFSLGSASEIVFTSAPVKAVSRRFSYTFPAHSVTSLVLTRR
jgi:alpha-N-arabinofuranosidase